MDKGLKGQYVAFFKGPVGQDLLNRIKTTEAKYSMEGMQAVRSKNMEAAALSIAQVEATYAIRTMLDDLATPEKPITISNTTVNQTKKKSKPA